MNVNWLFQTFLSTKNFAIRISINVLFLFLMRFDLIFILFFYVTNSRMQFFVDHNGIQNKLFKHMSRFYYSVMSDQILIILTIE